MVTIGVEEISMDFETFCVVPHLHFLERGCYIQLE